MDYNFAHGAFDCLCVNNGKHSPNNKYEHKIDNNTYLICYVTGGKGRIITDEKEIELKRGYSFLIYPFFEARIEEDTKNPLEYSWVEFKGLEAAWIITQTMFTRKNPVLKKMPVKSFAEHFNVICGENKSAYEQCRTNAKLLLLLSFYLEYFPQKPVKKNQYVGTAREYIDNNYCDSECTVKRVADHVKVDRTYLFRLFKKETGFSIIDYINNKRISKAVVMLSDESVSVKDISVAIGFTDQMYFSKVFKKIKGVTPTEYRKSCTKVYRLP